MVTTRILWDGASGMSPYVRKIKIVLNEMGLPFELRKKPGHGQIPTIPPEYARLNPAARSPVLQDGDRVVFESNSILEYLLETYPQQPANGEAPQLSATLVRPDHRWEDIALLSTIETILDSSMNLLQLQKSGVVESEVPYLQRETSRIQSCLDWLEARAHPEGFVPGTLSIMDVNLFCALLFGDLNYRFPWRQCATLEAIFNRVVQRSSVRATLASPLPEVTR